MSSSKKSSSSGEVLKSVSSKPSSYVGSKRSVEDVHPITGSGDVEDWYAMKRRVFVTRGPGTLANVGKNGQITWCFTIIGHFADGKSAAVQAWGDKAHLFSEFFTHNCKPDDGASVWVIPEARDSGLFFRLKDPTLYLIKFLNVDYVLTADYGPKTKIPCPAVTADDFPASYEWDDDMYALGGVLIPHYSLWGTIPPTPPVSSAPVAIDMTPRIRTFAQESPTKSKVPKLSASSSSASSSGMRHQIAMSAINMDDIEE